MNAATRARKYANPDPNAWLWEDVPDPYQDLEKRHATNKTGVDFYANKQRELHEFANQPTRVDLVVLPDGTAVRRVWLAGWDPGDPAWKAEPLKDGWTVDTAAEHLRARGWTIRHWIDERGNPGARAFRCGLRCVRTGAYRNRWRERAGVQVGITILDDRFDG